jgi:hypothetical protein
MKGEIILKIACPLAFEPENGGSGRGSNMRQPPSLPPADTMKVITILKMTTTCNSTLQCTALMLILRVGHNHTYMYSKFCRDFIKYTVI